MDPRRFDCRFNLLQQRPRFLLAQKVTITLGYFLGPSLGIDTKKLVHLRHDPNRGLIFGIEFNRVQKFPPCMCPTACMHDSGSAHSVICTVAVALEDSCKISKEPFGSFPFTPKPEIEHHRPVGSTVARDKLGGSFLCHRASVRPPEFHPPGCSRPPKVPVPLLLRSDSAARQLASPNRPSSPGTARSPFPAQGSRSGDRSVHGRHICSRPCQ